MKKILIYTMIMTRGGAENTIANLANRFIDDYEITIVTNIKEKCEYDLNTKIKYICLDTKNKRNENILLKILTKLSSKRTKLLRKVIEQEKPDLIISFLPEPTIRALTLKKDIPIIISIRNHPLKEFRFCHFLRDYFYKKADTIIVQDSSYSKYFNIKIQNKIKVIPNFIPNDYVVIKNYKKEKVILTATRLEKQKNLSFLINTFSQLDSKYNDYKLHICGEGKLRRTLERQVKKLGIENKVVFLGKTMNIKDELEKATLFVLPSNYEGMPNVVLEAMSYGLPVIATQSTEVMKILIENKRDGILIDKNDTEALIKHIEYLLNDENLRIKMGKNAKKKVLYFSENNFIQLWKNIIEDNLH